MATHIFDLTRIGIAASDTTVLAENPSVSWAEAENILLDLAASFPFGSSPKSQSDHRSVAEANVGGVALPEVDARYRTLVEQIPAVVFMAFLDKGIGEAYVSPQIEAILGFYQEEWLNDPVRWYQQIHPDDKGRWSVEAAQLFLSGQPLKSLYRVLARDGRVVWFQKPRWFAMMTANRGLFMAWLSISRNSKVRKLPVVSMRSV